MARIRITGIVQQANQFRQILSAPLTIAQRDAAAAELAHSLRQIDTILKEHGNSVSHLPPQSRRAYEFLRSIDWSRVPITSEAVASGPHAESVSYRGLSAFLERVLDNAAVSVWKGEAKPGAIHTVIARTRDRLERSMTGDGLSSVHLTPQTRSIVGWFRYFSEADALGRYLEAVHVAQRQFEATAAGALKWRCPLVVHFRPSSHLYRWSILSDGTRIVLNTPSLALEAEIFRLMGRQMAGDRSVRAAISQAVSSDEFQSLHVELEAAEGVVDRTRGMAYDLAEVFDRVNREHLGGVIERPHLTWNRTLTGRKFGHYDFLRDLVMISATLDSPKVPSFVVDHVMHHELLHKKHGCEWRGARRHAHTAEFRAEERTFPRYADANAFLQKLR